MVTGMLPSRPRENAGTLEGHPKLRSEIRMQKRANLIIPAIILGIILLAVAVLYFAEPAKSLPSFMPGHQSGSSHHHVKHGIAALVLSAGCFIFAWFQSGPKQLSN
jgi:hypothetical protein